MREEQRQFEIKQILESGRLFDDSYPDEWFASRLHFRKYYNIAIAFKKIQKAIETKIMFGEKIKKN
jgi:hypothetical protein